jgi:putative thioredoxin
MSTSPFVTDVDAAGFATDVIARSHEIPVIVDFWAEWCGPCKTLSPIIESAVDTRAGAIVLAKIDVDANPALQAQFRIKGIPAVKAFRDGVVVAEFTGAQNAAYVERFIDDVIPSPADDLAAAGMAQAATDPVAARAAFEEALTHHHTHKLASLGLAELLVHEDPQRAAALVSPHRPEPAAEAILTMISMAAGAGDLDTLSAAAQAAPRDDATLLAYGRALSASGEDAIAIEVLLAAVKLGGEHRDDARSALVDLLTIMGNDDDRVGPARRRLAAALY